MKQSHFNINVNKLKNFLEDECIDIYFKDNHLELKKLQKHLKQSIDKFVKKSIKKQ